MWLSNAVLITLVVVSVKFTVKTESFQWYDLRWTYRLLLGRQLQLPTHTKPYIFLGVETQGRNVATPMKRQLADSSGLGIKDDSRTRALLKLWLVKAGILHTGTATEQRKSIPENRLVYTKSKLYSAFCSAIVQWIFSCILKYISGVHVLSKCILNIQN